jgi:hypothetical protein
MTIEESSLSTGREMELRDFPSRQISGPICDFWKISGTFPDS